MPRLTEDQIKAGILHTDIGVRHAAVHYFSDCYSQNTTVMPVVIEALEKFGRTGTFRFPHLIDHVAQTEATIRWAIEELKTQPSRSEAECEYLSTMCRLLCDADPRLVRPFANDALTALEFASEHRDHLSRRLKFLTWDGEALWRELETICEEGKDQTYVGDMRWDEGEDIVEALARQGDQHAERTMDILRQKIEDYENNPMTWMESLAVRLAGELRHESAIPLIVAKLHEEDAEVLAEECQIALARIGGDGVIRAIRQDYASANRHFRLYASGVLGRVHTDLAVQALMELLPEEKDGELEDWLAQALISHFSTEGNEVARKMLLDDFDSYDLQVQTVAACTLMGQDFPEIEAWRKEIEAERGRRRFLPSNATWSPPMIEEEAPLPKSPPIERDGPRVGRNDPCPCGSGRKFKKCCINKKSVVSR